MKKSKKRPQVAEPTIPHSTKEKLILAMFLVAVILVIMILFRGAPQDGVFTGAATLSGELEKTAYDSGDEIEGKVTLALEEGDLLPRDTKIKILMLSSAEKCAEDYVCIDGNTVDWHEWDAVSETCELVNPDPEGKCCMRLKDKCNQVIVDNDFELSGYKGKLTYWRPDIIGGGVILDKAVGVEVGGAEDTDYSVFTNSLAYKSTATQTRAAIKQTLSTRSPEVSEFFGPFDPSQEEGGGGGALAGGNTNNGGKKLSFLTVKTLRWHYQYSTYEGCWFEIVVKGKSIYGHNRDLHYIYIFPDAEDECRPQTAANYIIKGLPADSYEYEWYEDSADLYTDWINAGFRADDNITEIVLVSHGVEVDDPVYGPTWYGQTVFWDRVTLRKAKGIIASLDCLQQSRSRAPKKCCAEGTGLGSYYGDQLECSQGFECWEDCTQHPDKTEFTLSQFVSMSDSRAKKNIEYGDCGFMSDGEFIDLEDFCDEGGVGPGYAACPDTSSSAPRYCRNWDNEYEVDIEKLRFRAPSQNGSYELLVRAEYKPSWYDDECPENEPDYEYCNPIFIYETSTPFYVGEEPTPPICPDYDYDWKNLTSWTEWSSCIDSYETRTRTIKGTYAGEEVGCEQEVEKEEEDFRFCGEEGACIVTDWECDAWTPTLCPSSAMQTRFCYVTGVCNETVPGYAPEITRSCTPEQKGKALMWLIWTIVILVLVFVAAVVIMKIRPKATGKPRPFQPPKTNYPELVSYIRDALATGATKQEIATKLSEAGWPKQAIDASFRALKR